MSIGELSEIIVDAIVKDIRDRNGIGNALDEIDDATRYDMEDDWRLIVRRILEAAP